MSGDDQRPAASDQRPAASRKPLASRLLIGLVGINKRWISPLLPPACRYPPTCSTYMAEAIEVHGPVKGVWLGGRRLCRCHPWGGHGWDPVPPKDLPSGKAR